MKLDAEDAKLLRSLIKRSGVQLKIVAEAASLSDSAISNGLTSNSTKRRSIPDAKLRKIVAIIEREAKQLDAQQYEEFIRATKSLSVALFGEDHSHDVLGRRVSSLSPFFLPREAEVMELAEELRRGNNLIHILGGAKTGKTFVVDQASKSIRNAKLTLSITLDQEYARVAQSSSPITHEDLLRSIAMSIPTSKVSRLELKDIDGLRAFQMVLDTFAEESSEGQFPYIEIQGIEQFIPLFENPAESISEFFAEIGRFRLSGVRLGLILVWNSAILTNKYASNWIYSSAPFVIVAGVNKEELRVTLQNKFKNDPSRTGNSVVFERELDTACNGIMRITSGHIYLVHALVSEMTTVTTSGVKEAIGKVMESLNNFTFSTIQRSNPWYDYLNKLRKTLDIADEIRGELEGLERNFEGENWSDHLNFRWYEALKNMAVVGGERYNCNVLDDGSGEVINRLCLKLTSPKTDN